jgi:hypothetical protein
VEIDWPKDVEAIVKEVGAKLKQGQVLGSSCDNDENAALEVMDRLRTKWMNDDPKKTIATWDWATKQYFKLLLIDWRRLGFFRNHELCKPEGQDC